MPDATFFIHVFHITSFAVATTHRVHNLPSLFREDHRKIFIIDSEGSYTLPKHDNGC